MFKKVINFFGFYKKALSLVQYLYFGVVLHILFILQTKVAITIFSLLILNISYFLLTVIIVSLYLEQSNDKL